MSKRESPKLAIHMRVCVIMRNNLSSISNLILDAYFTLFFLKGSLFSFQKVSVSPEIVFFFTKAAKRGALFISGEH